MSDRDDSVRPGRGGTLNMQRIIASALAILVAGAIAGTVMMHSEVKSQDAQIEAHRRLDDSRFSEIQRRLTRIEDKLDQALEDE